jgi:hypothetical protein
LPETGGAGRFAFGSLITHVGGWFSSRHHR